MNKLRHQSRALSQGFTLIEVMVALVVLSVTLAAVTQVASQSLRTQQAVIDSTVGRWVAQNQLAEIRAGQAQNSDVMIFQPEGEVEMAGKQWTWTAISEPTASADLMKIRINARPSESHADTSVAEVVGFFAQ